MRRGAILRVVSKAESVTVPAGTFDCLPIVFDGPCADAGVTDEWFARGVGLVKRSSDSIAGPRGLELERATVLGEPVPPP